MTAVPDHVTGLTIEHDEARDALLGAIDAFGTAVEALDEIDVLAPSRCWGWSVLDTAVHVRVGLEEMLRGFTSPTDEAADVDAASYWSAQAPVVGTSAGDERDDVAGILWTRRTASAYARPAGAVAHLSDVSDAVRGATAAASPGRVRFQGYVLTTADFLATWAVELAVHQLDLGGVIDVPAPPSSALGLARRTVEALVGAPLPSGLDDVTAVLLGAGRVSPDEHTTRLLGELAQRLPAFH